MKNISIFLLLVAVVGYSFWKPESSDFYDFAKKTEPFLNLKDFKSGLRWDRAALVTPYTKMCFGNDCISSSTESESYLVLIRDGKVSASFEYNERDISFAKWPYWVTREAASFKKNSKTNKYEFLDANFFESYSPEVRKFTLKSGNGDKPFCKTFLTGNANCFYLKINECEKDLSDSFEACLPNQPGATKEVLLKWKEIEAPSKGSSG